MYIWPSTIKINTGWSDSASADIISNTPEVGAPIRRLRSYNVKHKLGITFDLSLSDYTTVFLPFIASIKGGTDGFIFYDFTSLTPSTVTAYVEDPTSPYTIKRRSDYDYTISMSIVFIKQGALIYNA